MPSTPPKILRVGVMRDGNIVEEKVMKTPASVTVGSTLSNTLVISGSTVASQLLFELRDERYWLNFTDQMDGKVDAEDFAALKSSGKAARRGDGWTVPLTFDAKGKVTVGGHTLLFQFIQPAPAPTAVKAPDVPLAPGEVSAGIHGGFWAEMDRFFFGILAVSLLIHFSGATCIALSPKPIEPELSLDQLPDRFAKLLIPPKAPEPEKLPETPQGTEEKKEEKAEAPKKDSPPKDAAQRKAEVQQKVASKGLLKILGSTGGEGALADVLGSSGGTNDIASALAGAGGVGVASSDAVAGGQKGGGTGDVAGIGDLATSGGGNVNLGEKKEAAVSGRVKDAAPEVESSDVDREALAKYVRARLSAIKNCYEKELKRNPSLKGKVVVRFSITPAGRTGDIEIEENTTGNEAVGACIRTVIRSWVFPFKPDDEVPVAYPFVFSPAG